MEPTTALIIAAAWIVCGIASLLIAQGRGATNTASWFLVGVILGPIGLLLAIVAARPPRDAQRNAAIDELRQLAQLKAEGAITDAEYEAKKKQLLGA